MHKICLNTRDELLVIDLDKIAFFQANGNYTQMTYTDGESHLLSVGLAKAEELIRLTWPADIPSPFVRLGRSLMINQNYLTEISIMKQRIVLSDHDGHAYPLSVPKPLLKDYKDRINEIYLRRILKQ